jgi:hypothetical protein
VIREKVPHPGGHGLRISRGNYESHAPVGDEMSIVRYVRGDDRHSTGHRFEERVRRPFVPRRQDRHVARGIHSLHFIHVPNEPKPLREASLLDRRANASVIVTDVPMGTRARLEAKPVMAGAR